MADKTLQDYYNKSIIVDKDIQKIFEFENGDVKTVTNYDAILQSIRNILYTKKGELIGLVSFGSSLQNLLYEPLNIKNIDAWKNTIIAEINKWDNRVNVIDFQYKMNTPQIGYLQITMIFNIKAMGESLVYREQFTLSSSAG